MQIPPLGSRFTKLARNDHIVLAIIALGVGILTAYAAILFRLSIEGVQWVALGFGGENVFTMAAQQPWWRVLLAPVIGGLLVGLILHFLMPNKRQQGVAQVMEATALRGGFMRLRDGLYAALLSVTALGSGSSTGREGPMVHLGASLASFVAAKLHLGPSFARTILGCGVASAVAASFNAPIAGVFFALEVIIGRYAMGTFAPVVIAGVAGTVISRIHLGEQPAFIIPNYAIVSSLEFPAFVLLGIVCALIAVIFIRSIFLVERFHAELNLPVWIRPGLAGLMVGLIALLYPHILGVGYEATDAALKENFSISLLIALITAKIAATSICIGSRFGGGIFSPSLFIGATIGAAFGVFAAAAFPELAASDGAYAIVGMSAFAGAVLGAPISTIFIVFELIGDSKMIIATMVATSTAALLARQIEGGSFFLRQLDFLGIDIDPRPDRRHKVKEILSDNFVILTPDTNGLEMLRHCREDGTWNFLVMDGRQFLGAVPFPVLRDFVMSDPEDLEPIIAADLVDGHWPIVHLEDTVADALLAVEQYGAAYLPVLGDEDDKVLGIVRYPELLRASHDESDVIN